LLSWDKVCAVDSCLALGLCVLKSKLDSTLSWTCSDRDKIPGIFEMS
jgi:hypothetical protein